MYDTDMMMMMMMMMIMIMIIVNNSISIRTSNNNIAVIQHTVAACDLVIIMRAMASLWTREQEKGRTTGTVDLGGT